MSKFICENCKKEKDIPHYIIAIRNGQPVYINKSNKREICCDECNQKLKPVIEEVDLTGVKFHRFSSMSVQEKQKLLKKRSHAHFEKEIKERKHEMGKETIKKLLNK